MFEQSVTPEQRDVERQDVLDAFAECPDDNVVWETAYAWVRAEGDISTEPGVASDIPAEELVAMAETVRATDASARYHLMTTRASNGKLWFDVIEGFSSKPVREVLRRTVASGVAQRQAPFYCALDLDTGIGNSLQVLEENAEQVVAVDRNPALLTVAAERASAFTSVVQADVTRLPFEADSFDLVNSLGVEGSLDREARTAFYTELARVMMPGGIYVSAFYNYPTMPSAEMAQITQTSKAMLSDMICDTVSGGASITDRLDGDETDELLTSLGLSMEYYTDFSEGDQDQVLIQVVRKELAALDY